MGPCMCGDTYCHSCGPAQGNYKCPICGKWGADGGCDDVEKCNKLAAEQDDALAKQMEEWDKIEKDYMGR